MLYDYLTYEDIKYINIYVERGRKREKEKQEKERYIINIIYINYELLLRVTLKKNATIVTEQL